MFNDEVVKKFKGVVSRKARRGRNPQTGQTIQIPAKKLASLNRGKDQGRG